MRLMAMVDNPLARNDAFLRSQVHYLKMKKKADASTDSRRAFAMREAKMHLGRCHLFTANHHVCLRSLNPMTSRSINFVA